MQSSPQQLTVERSISVAPQRAFGAWSDATEVSTWFTTEARQEFRVGGRYSNVDNDRGEYLEIEPPVRLRFTWDNPDHSPGTLVTVEFVPEAEDITTVRLTHEGLESESAVAEMSYGWEWALDSLKSYLETGSPLPFDEWQSRKEMGV